MRAVRSSRRQGAPRRGDCSAGESLSRPHALLDPAPARALRTRRRGWRRLGDRSSRAYAECAQRALSEAPWPWCAAAAHGESRPGGPGKWRPEGRGPGGLMGSRGGSASPGGFGREAVALGRAAMGREVSGRPPERRRPRTSRRAPSPGHPARFPSPSAATFLYLPRVIRASNSSSLLPSLSFCRLFLFLLDPGTFCSPLRWSWFEKVARSLDPGRQACVTCGLAICAPRRPREWRGKRSCALPEPQNFRCGLPPKDEGFTWTGKGRPESGVTSAHGLLKLCFSRGLQSSVISFEHLYLPRPRAMSSECIHDK